MELSNKLIDEVKFDFVVVEKNWDGERHNDQHKKSVDPIIVFIAGKKKKKIRKSFENSDCSLHRKR